MCLGPLLGVGLNNLDDELVGSESDCVDSVVSEADEDLEDGFGEVVLGDEEGLQDVDYLALDAPVVGVELGQQRLGDFVFKGLLGHFGSQVLETSDDAQGDLAVGVFHEVEDDGQH